MKDNEKKITAKLICSVCICTYKRPELLKNLIESLNEQRNIDDIELEIIVVDNDPLKSAENIIMSTITMHSINYFYQPNKNISLTRNTAIQNASGKYIAFIDDDETADKSWVKNLISCCIKYQADAVFGYVIPVFEEPSPDWLRQRELYFKPLKPTGSEPDFWYTSNCLIKSDIIKQNGVLFDEKRGLSGGEDGLFFRTLKENLNAKFVCCKEAISYEFVPLKRQSTKYLCSRNFQIGNLYAKRKMNEKKKIPIINWFVLFLRFSLVFIYHLLGVVLLFPNKSKWIFSYTAFCAAAGKLSGMFNYKYEHYSKFE